MANSLRKSRFSSALDLGVAALAAVAAGFAFFAMPEGLFASIVVKSGLPKVLAAAQPPLGGTARLAAVAAAGLLVFAFVWSLLRALDGTSARPAVVTDDEEGEAPQGEVLRLRKADVHPDAPARRPIQAGRELGEPFPPDILELETPAEPEAEPECRIEAEPEPEPAPEAEPQAEPAVDPQPVPGFLVAQEIPPEAEPEPDSQPAPGDSADLSQLMERFESGLTRKQQAIVRAVPPPEPAAPGAPAPEAAAEEPTDRVGHRLRSAIAELQKVSGRGG